MMRRFVDLHTHSTASDGSVSPTELVRLAEREQLAALALTDHDTTDGLTEARREARLHEQLKFVGGIEVSAIFPGGTLHILGLGIDETSPAIAELCRQLRSARDERNPKIIAKLQAMGMNITWDDVLAQCGQPAADSQTSPGRVIGRVHIAQAMCRKGLVKSMPDAFEKYIGAGGSAYVDKERLTPRQIIQAIHAGGGIAVLAHPPQLHYQNLAQLERIVRDFIHAGMDGIEAYHSDNSDQQTRQYLELANRFGLAVTGGSDFHGPAKPNVRLGKSRVPLSMIEEEWAEKIFARS